ncbi:TPA: ead/Ea22-like family protein [Salmonella enterica]|uniref:Ead/Ea22-like family protein n=1 Tax=Salmonella enterica TaxID=28901 RepID=A0A721DDR3_SALER|nr:MULTISPECIES: ead/Ea22-like family protein [Salmonella]EAA7874336.1 ead/Ea22-like family protein [Salmonella enterica subsp. enterica serovar Lexington]EAO5729820.1 ead/Ea22-like family protein [Salmonella enterica]EBN0301435.1 ead/Ea22-like family protein [Salmonella enterica subsp. enterica serovar Newport]EBS0356664.1 ead/Ea22-like family protein [Salmonella enterica subsp. enterica serovar Java]EBV0105356.1 ead/Ea22-like family protein [Salmonella enterica subsp. enterica serovar Derby]
MTIDKQALRQKAVKAGGEEWQSRKMPGPAGEYTVIVKGSLEKHPGWTTCRPVADEVIDKKTMDFIAAANPATVLALLDELEAETRYREGAFIACNRWHDKFRDADDKLEAAERRIAEQSAIVAAAEKLVRCKGRYHSELNYRALAKLFGVITPDLPPLEHENVHYADAAEVEITALRQRIAELEAREVTLPPTFWYEHDDLSRDIPVLDKRLVKKAIRAAGIKVKES